MGLHNVVIHEIRQMGKRTWGGGLCGTSTETCRGHTFINPKNLKRERTKLELETTGAQMPPLLTLLQLFSSKMQGSF